MSIFLDSTEWLDLPCVLLTILCTLITAHELDALAKWPFSETYFLPQPGHSIFGLELEVVSALVFILSYA